MKQGEIWFANLDPTTGSQQAGFRPLLIISGNLLNDLAPVLVCCPLTTQIKNFHGNLVLEPTKQNGLKTKSEVLTLHIRSVSKNRFKEKIGKIDQEQMKIVHKCLEDILNY